MHWEGLLVNLPGQDGQVARVLGLAGSDGRTLRLQHGGLDPVSGSWAPAADQPDETLDPSTLSLVMPSKKDRVKVLGETDTLTGPGAVGTLIGMDGTDGIVKVDNSTDLCIIDMRLLGKMVSA